MRNFNLSLIILIAFITCSCKLSQQEITDRLQGEWLLEKTFYEMKNSNNPIANSQEKLFIFDTIKFEGDKYRFHANYRDEVKIVKGEFKIIKKNILVLKDSLLIKTLNKRKLEFQLTIPFKCTNCSDSNNPKFSTILATFKKQ
jgi:hypothetical protein